MSYLSMLYMSLICTIAFACCTIIGSLAHRLYWVIPNAMVHFAVVLPLLINRLNEGFAAGFVVLAIDVFLSAISSVYLLSVGYFERKAMAAFIVGLVNAIALTAFGIHLFLFAATP